VALQHRTQHYRPEAQLALEAWSCECRLLLHLLVRISARRGVGVFGCLQWTEEPARGCAPMTGVAGKYKYELDWNAKYSINQSIQGYVRGEIH
jgi:hypothetical protein